MSLDTIFGTDVKMNTTADIRVIKSEEDLKSKEHLYRVLDSSDERVEGMPIRQVA